MAEDPFIGILNLVQICILKIKPKFICKHKSDSVLSKLKNQNNIIVLWNSSDDHTQTVYCIVIALVFYLLPM